MNRWRNFILGVVLLGLFSIGSFAQTALTQTTLAAGVTTTAQIYVRLTSATGVTANNTILFMDSEAMFVNSVSGTVIGITRGYFGTQAMTHASGAMVLIGPPAAFVDIDPSGSCTPGSGIFAYAPIVNLKNGNQWLCSSVTNHVIPGFENNAAPAAVSAAVASAAGLITPSGPLFHITGTAAITGFTIPVGFDPKEGSQVCVIPDGLWTTTNANNLALASTAVVSKTLCWTYDSNTAKFYPSY